MLGWKGSNGGAHSWSTSKRNKGDLWSRFNMIIWFNQFSYFQIFYALHIAKSYSFKSVVERFFLTDSTMGFLTILLQSRLHLFHFRCVSGDVHLNLLSFQNGPPSKVRFCRPKPKHRANFQWQSMRCLEDDEFRFKSHLLHLIHGDTWPFLGDTISVCQTSGSTPKVKKVTISTSSRTEESLWLDVH